MMNENGNNGGKGLFYGVIGVATLIVAIIGATFAWFTATANSGKQDLITTGTLKIVYEDGRDLVATNLKPATLDQVKAAYLANNCKYQVSNSSETPTEQICSVYSFTVTNSGSLQANLSAKITGFAIADALTEEQRIANGNTPITADTSSYFKYAIVDNAPGTAVAAETTGASLASATTLSLPGGNSIAKNAESTNYIIIWLDSDAGNDYQGITASATITVDAAQTNVTQ